MNITATTTKNAVLTGNFIFFLFYYFAVVENCSLFCYFDFFFFLFCFQINVDKFNVGRFISHTNEGCPDGYMAIAERDFPSMGGQWCGTAWGYNVYYSESSSINVSLKIYKLFQQQGLTDNFSFKLTYKFLKKTVAKLR